MSVEQYFGENGAFAEACELYRCLLHSVALPAERDALTQELLNYASTLGSSRIAYTLGFCFAKVLKRRGLEISEEDLAKVSKKITAGNPERFIEGFRVYR